MTAVFLSYRRSDSRKDAGRLSDCIRQKIGTSWVFRDVVDIAAGSEFDAVLERELETVRVVLVLIGPGWSQELARRLQEPEVDYLRLEIARSLEQGKRVVPLLLDGAALPAAGDLPEDLAPLAKRQAMTLRDESWSEDVDRLIEAIGRPYRWGLLALRAALALGAILVAVWKLSPEGAGPDVARTWALSLAAVYALVEAAFGYQRSRGHRRAQGGM